jgi:hypothetical protein
MIRLQPFDVVVVDGLWYMPHHWMIKWRSLENASHCATIRTPQGEIYNPVFEKVKMENISHYFGRVVSIHRYNQPFDYEKLVAWGDNKVKTQAGYDFWNQWIFGFVLGVTDSIADCEDRWTCAEFPYWAFQDNSLKLTSKDERCPLPRLFRYNDDFTLLFNGLLTEKVVDLS